MENIELSALDKARAKSLFIQYYFHENSYEKALLKLPIRLRRDRRTLTRWMNEDPLFAEEVESTRKARSSVVKFAKDMTKNKGNLEKTLIANEVTTTQYAIWRRTYSWFDTLMNDIKLGSAYLREDRNERRIDDFAEGKLNKIITKATDMDMSTGKPKKANQTKISLQYEASKDALQMSKNTIKENMTEAKTLETGDDLELTVEKNKDFEEDQNESNNDVAI